MAAANPLPLPAPGRRAGAALRLRALMGGADLSRGDRLLRAACGMAALIPLLALVFLVVPLAISAVPSVLFSGPAFLTGQVFSFGNLYAGSPSLHHGVAAPAGAQYGALPILLGTLFTSLVALLLGVPVAVGGVVLLAELPLWFQRMASLLLELLASIPSVVYGLWGIITFGPLVAKYVYPGLAATLGRVVPFFGGAVGYGQGLLTAGLILAVMIVPIIATTTRELVRMVPVHNVEGAYALGLTPFESLRTVTLPFIRGGILAAALLGWARALGETMAVLMISGNALNVYPVNIYGPVSTMAGTIAVMLDSALTDATGLALHALAELALVLLVVTFLTNLLGRLVVRRFTSTALPIGRGI